MKTCTLCKEEKEISKFYLNKSGANKGSYTARCKECTKKKRQAYYDKNKDRLNRNRREKKKNNSKYKEKVNRQKRESYRNNIITSRLWQAKQRAEKYDVEFSLKEEDVHIPEKCPLLEIDLEIGRKGNYENSPSLDRINPNKGYTKDNIWVISKKANSMKNSATKEELKIFIKNVQEKLL